MKRLFVVDWILVFVFVLSAFSGFGLHIAGHEGNHSVWHDWALFHVAVSLLFLVAVISHLSAHKGWYKGILKSGLGSKSKVTFMLSLLFLLLSVTGIIMLGINGTDSPMGLWHYKIGIVTCMIAIAHILKRISILRKSVNKLL